MSQHDYVIENQSGANVRADLNNALSAIVTSNSGATEPATKFAYMFWSDTTSGWVKQRNAANTAWIKRFPLGTGASVDVASAATVDLTATAVSSDYIRITGTTTITAITLEAGQKRTILAGGAFTLTNSATLVVSGASNYTTTAGDVFTAIGEAGSVVRINVNRTSQTLIRSTLGDLETVIQANATDVVTIGSTGIKAGSYAPLSVTPAALSQKITSATALATTSGTSFDFTSIPSWVKKITIILNGVSTSGTSNLLVQFGSTSIETTGYLSQSNTFNVSPASAVSTAGFLVTSSTTATAAHNTLATGCNISGNTWIFAGNGAAIAATNGVTVFGGSKTLAGVLDQVRLTTVNGTDTFDAGSVNIIYEG